MSDKSGNREDGVGNPVGKNVFNHKSLGSSGGYSALAGSGKYFIYNMENHEIFKTSSIPSNCHIS